MTRVRSKKHIRIGKSLEQIFKLQIWLASSDCLVDLLYPENGHGHGECSSAEDFTNRHVGVEVDLPIGVVAGVRPEGIDDGQEGRHRC